MGRTCRLLWCALLLAALTSALVVEPSADEQDWATDDELQQADVKIGQEGIKEDEAKEELLASSTLRCHRGRYETEVEQTDGAGRRCWDVVKLDMCWGRCDSYQISDWKFPFRHTRHPVCGFAGRLDAFVRLRFCDEGASPEASLYRYVRPLACRCRACASADTNCGWLPAASSGGNHQPPQLAAAATASR